MTTSQTSLHRAAVVVLCALAFQSVALALDRPGRDEIRRVSQRLADMNAASVAARNRNAPWAQIDAENTTELKTMLRRYAWFKTSVWGARADLDAFLIVQHSQDLAFQRSVLSRLEILRQTGETAAWNYAYLYDRVILSKEFPNGQTALAPDDVAAKQRYGTQGTCGVFGWQPFPVEQPDRIDQLRAKVGLGPLDDYVRSMQATCAAGGSQAQHHGS